MKYSSYQFITLSVLISFMANPAVAQEGSGGGGESPAESSVSTSSSKKSKAAPEAIESNPVVTVVRAGIDLSTAKDMGIAGVRKIAKAGGSFKNLRHVSKAIAKKEVDHTHVDKAIDAGLTGGGDGAGLHFLKAAGHIKTGKLELGELNDLKTAIDKNINIDQIFKDESEGGHGSFKAVKTLVDAGFTGEHLEHLKASELTNFIGTDGIQTLGDPSRALEAKGHLANGISLTKLVEHGIGDVTKAVNSGYSTEELNNLTSSSLDTVVGHIDSGLSKDEAAEAESSGVSAETTLSLLAVGIPTNLVSSVAALNLSSADLTKLSSNLSKGVLYTTNTTKGISVVYDALAAGYTSSEVETFDKDKLTQLIAMVQAGVIKSEANAYQSFGLSLDSAVSLSNVQNTVLKSTINDVLADASYTAPTHQAALTSAASVADSILRDISLKSATDFPTAINVASFVGNGYNTELVKLLVKYGAIGSKGSELATAAINGFSTTSSTSSSLSGLLSTSSSDYLSLLSKLTGNSDLGDPDGDNDNFMQSTVLDVKLNKINLITGANIALGAKGSTSTLDVTPMLTKSTSTADRKVLVIGAAKDMTIAGDVTFTNSNDVEDHALAIGAADDLYLRSEYSQANNADYDNPAPINIKYTGSNLGLGSEDTMRLVNVNIETGGNLAISSLDELHIGLSDSQSSTFSVGTGGKNSDPDNIYLVANNLIQVNGLNFSGRLDDVYMEAITINLKDVAFPSTADVMLRSRDGTLHFNTFNNRVVGGVNLTGVSHGGTTLNSGHFDNGPAGHIDSTISLPNGTAAIKIRKQ
jgi:hypothetical protein